MGAAGWAILAAVFFAVGIVLQQRGAMAAPPAGSSGFLGSILSKPVWLAGGACQIVGWVAQGAALDRGALFLVQPLISLQVVFALPLGVWLTGQRAGRREWTGALAVVGSLAVFLAVSDPSAGRSSAPADVWLEAAAAIAVLVVVLAVVAAHRRPAARAAAYGAAAGVLFGFQAAVMKAFVDVVHDGLRALATNWSSYALLASALAGFWLVQVSLQVGVLAPAIASTNAANPIASAALGRFVFLEVPQRTAGGKVASLASLVALLLGLGALAAGEAPPGAAGPRPAPHPS